MKQRRAEARAIGQLGPKGDSLDHHWEVDHKLSVVSADDGTSKVKPKLLK